MYFYYEKIKKELINCGFVSIYTYFNVGRLLFEVKNNKLINFNQFINYCTIMLKKELDLYIKSNTFKKAFHFYSLIKQGSCVKENLFLNNTNLLYLKSKLFDYYVDKMSTSLLSNTIKSKKLSKMYEYKV